MITRLTYNCNPESLGDIDRADFVDAMENEFHAAPKFRETRLTVTFTSEESGVDTADFTTDDYTKYDALEEEVKSVAERAFNACCAA